jgi:hypothetical protein
MRAYRQPLSEAFVYSSPERPMRGSYRWVAAQTELKSPMRLISREVRDEPKRRR